MEVKNILKHYQHAIGKELDALFSSLKKQYHYLNHASMIFQSMENFSKRGGKRLRPVVMIQGYNLFKPENREIIKTSIAIELIHNFLLVHDDIMDRDQLRRGGLTINRLYADYFKSRLHNAHTTHLGNSTAMTIGNIFFSLGSAVISNSSFPEKNRCRALAAVSEMITNVGIGQFYDITYSLKDDLTEEDILLMYHLKTAEYSFSGPLVLGAILAGATSPSIKKIVSFAKPLGLAFQIKDDLLDLYSTESTLGKTVGSDFREAKKTLFLTTMLKRAHAREREVILRSLGNRKLTRSTIEVLKKVGIETGAFDYCTSLSERLVREAKDILHHAPFRKEAIPVLLYIADYIHTREL